MRAINVTLNFFTKFGCVQVRGEFPSLRPLSIILSVYSMWNGSARDRTSSESDPASRRRPCDRRAADPHVPLRLTYLMEWNPTSGGERLRPWLQGKDTSTTRTLVHSSRNSEVIYAALTDSRTQGCGTSQKQQTYPPKTSSVQQMSSAQRPFQKDALATD